MRARLLRVVNTILLRRQQRLLENGGEDWEISHELGLVKNQGPALELKPPDANDHSELAWLERDFHY